MTYYVEERGPFYYSFTDTSLGEKGNTTYYYVDIYKNKTPFIQGYYKIEILSTSNSANMNHLLRQATTEPNVILLNPGTEYTRAVWPKEIYEYVEKLNCELE